MGPAIFAIILCALMIFLAYIIIKFIIKLLFEPKASTKTKRVRTYYEEELEGMRQAKWVMDRETYDAIKNWDFGGRLPEKQPDGRWSSMYPNIKTFNIAGINFRTGLNPLVDKLLECYLVEEPDNEFDENAIKIVHKDTKKHLGYVPADKTDWMRSITKYQFPYPCKAVIEKRQEFDELLDKEKEFFIGRIIVEKATEPPTETPDDITPEMLLNNPELLRNP